MTQAFITSEDPDVVFRQIAKYVSKMSPEELAELRRLNTKESVTEFGTITLVTHPLFATPSR